MCFLPCATNAKEKKPLSWSHCVKDCFDGLQTACWNHRLRTQGCPASRGDAAGGQGDEKGALPRSGTTSMSRGKALWPHGGWKTSKPHAEVISHSTILAHSQENSVLLLMQTISLPPARFLLSKNTCPQSNADPWPCHLGRGNSRFKVGHPGTKQSLSCTWWTGLAHFMCGVALSRVHPHKAIALYLVTLASDYSRARGKRKILPVCDLPLSELWPSVCLALSITVSCLTLCCPLALNWGKTAQIQVQLKWCFMGVTLNAL